MSSDRELQPTDLIGAWNLQSWQMLSGPENTVHYPYGEDAEGLLIYSAAGLVSATIGRRERAPWQGKPGDADLADAFKSYLHYLARFSLSQNLVTHAVIMASAPQMVGHAHSRSIEVLAPDRLRYTGVDNPGSPAQRTHIFIWQRVPDSH